MKQKWALAMAVCMAMGQAVPAMAAEVKENTMEVSVWGQKLNDDGVMLDGVLYVPLRKTFEQLDQTVHWYPELNETVVRQPVYPTGSTFSYSTQFPLVAAFPQAGISVYGAKPDGMVIVEKDLEKTSYVKVPYGLEKQTLPKLRYGEYNGDGKRDFSVSVLTEYEPNVQKESLYLLQQSEDGWNSTLFSNESLLADAKAAVSSHFAEGCLVLSVGGEETKVPLEQEATVDFGRVIRFFTTKSYLEAQLPVFALTEENGIGEEIGLLKAEVLFDGTAFTMGDWQFMTMEDVTSNQLLTETALALMQRDLDVEGVFNAGLNGDWEKSVEIGAWHYAPVVSDRFHSLADLEQWVRGTYSNEERCNDFLSRLTGEDAYVKEVDGVLYVNADIGGKGMALQLDEESLRVKLLSPNQAEITFDFDLFDYDTLPSKLTMTKVDGTWLLDTGVYNVAQLAD